MYFNRFDIAEAWYLWLSHNHSGMYSREYARLSKLSLVLNAPFLTYDTLSENGKAIYDAIEAKHGR